MRLFVLPLGGEEYFSLALLCMQVCKKVLLFFMCKMPSGPQNSFATCKFKAFIIYQQFEQNKYILLYILCEERIYIVI